MDEMAVELLEGQPLIDCAKRRGISTGRAKTALIRFCLKTNPELYRQIMGNRVPHYLRLSPLRANKEGFLSRVAVLNKVTRHSSIWCLDTIAGVTLGGLYSIGIDTIEQFMATPEKEMLRFCCVGKDGVRKIWSEIHTLGL